MKLKLNQMKILVLGATGRTGKHVINEAVKKGHSISAIARDPAKLKDYQADVVQGSPYDYETVEKAIAGCEAVINTLNISRRSDNPWSPLAAPADLISKSAANAIRAMEKTGIKRFVALSTYGAGSSWKETPGLLKLFVTASNLRYAFKDHTRQEEILKSSSLDFTICRAPMLSSDMNSTGTITSAELDKPAGMKLSRNSAAEFFIRIIENREHLREIINLSNRQ